MPLACSTTLEVLMVLATSQHQLTYLKFFYVTVKRIVTKIERFRPEAVKPSSG